MPAWLFHDMPDAGDLADYHPPTATRVYAWDGTLIGEFSRERRIFVPYDQIPPQLVQAFLAAEDHNFFQHGGVDVGGIVPRHGQGRGQRRCRAAGLEGGSTITQQVAKNVLLTNDATVGRKLKEAILAQRLEQTLTKEQILELYLNEIWLGYRSYGVGAAAYNYFGKSITDLDLAAVRLSGRPAQGAGQLSARCATRPPAMRRRNWILGQMADLGWVSRAEAEAAMAEDLKVQAAPSRAKYRDADYFVEEVRRSAPARRSGRSSTEGGYYMRTTLDPRLQTAARIALMDGLETYDRRHGWRGAWGHVATLDRLAEGGARPARPPAERTDWRAAVVTERRRRRPRAGRRRRRGRRALAARGRRLGAGRQGPDGRRPDLRRARRQRAASACARCRRSTAPWWRWSPTTGRVLAMVGGYCFSLSNFNRATQADAPAGLVVQAVRLRHRAGERLHAGQRRARRRRSRCRAPTARPGRRRTTSTTSWARCCLRRGLELSLQHHDRAPGQAGRHARRSSTRPSALGVVDKMEPVLAMALGAGETTPFRLTARLFHLRQRRPQGRRRT